VVGQDVLMTYKSYFPIGRFTKMGVSTWRDSPKPVTWYLPGMYGQRHVQEVQCSCHPHVLTHSFEIFVAPNDGCWFAGIGAGGLPSIAPPTAPGACKTDCANGGSCVGDDVCLCPNGWEGRFCDQRGMNIENETAVAVSSHGLNVCKSQSTEYCIRLPTGRSTMQTIS
jgi:hypothetical protein